LFFKTPDRCFYIIMAFIIGKKVGMTRFFQEDGKVVPVTLIEAEPVVVTQIRTKEKDGYEAVQIGSGKQKKINKPKSGHLKDLGDLKTLREFKELKAKIGPSAGETGEGGEEKLLERGDKFDVSVFNIGDIVKISGLTKGRGFQGAVKRHGFHGMPASHGHHHVLRHVGSIGQRFPQHTLKGTRMAGRMGGVRQTTRGLKIVDIDKENNLMIIKGAVQGRKGTLLEISTL
jgi:large subunit ribosomal protein L3